MLRRSLQSEHDEGGWPIQRQVLILIHEELVGM